MSDLLSVAQQEVPMTDLEKITAMRTKLETIANWTEKNARHLRAEGAKCARFESLQLQYIADAKMYEATAKDIRALLEKVKA